MEASPEIIPAAGDEHKWNVDQLFATVKKIDTPSSLLKFWIQCVSVVFFWGGTLTIQVGIASFDSSCLRLWGNCRDPGAKKKHGFHLSAYVDHSSRHPSSMVMFVFVALVFFTIFDNCCFDYYDIASANLT